MTKATAIPEASFAYVVQGERMQKCCETDSDSKTFNSNSKIVKERIWITVKLTIQKIV